MKVRFLKDGESPDIGPFKKDEIRDLDPKLERLFIERGIAELSSAPAYKGKKKKTEEVTDDE